MSISNLLYGQSVVIKAQRKNGGNDCLPDVAISSISNSKTMCCSRITFSPNSDWDCCYYGWTGNLYIVFCNHVTRGEWLCALQHICILPALPKKQKENNLFLKLWHIWTITHTSNFCQLTFTIWNSSICNTLSKYQVCVFVTTALPKGEKLLSQS